MGFLDNNGLGRLWQHINSLLGNYVPKARTINGKNLTDNITLSASDVSAIPTSAKGAASGVASLGTDGKVPTSQLPALGETNQNAFSNIKVGSTTIAADSKTDTLTVAAGANITLTPDASGDTLTIAATDTTYSAATTSADGLMTSAMVTKLNGIAANANNYSHPTSAGNKHIPSGGSSDQILRWSANGTAAWGEEKKEVVIVNFSDGEDGIVADKTFEEIYQLGISNEAIIYGRYMGVILPTLGFEEDYITFYLFLSLGTDNVGVMLNWAPNSIDFIMEPMDKSSSLCINISNHGENFSADKTYDEIMQAYENNMSIYAKLDETFGVMSAYLVLTLFAVTPQTITFSTTFYDPADCESIKQYRFAFSSSGSISAYIDAPSILQWSHDTDPESHQDIRNLIPTKTSDLTNDSGFLIIDPNGAGQGSANGLNADTLGGVLAKDYALKTDLNNKVSKTGDVMTGTLTLESAMYPTIRLMPTNNVPQHSVIEGSYVGATSFAAWEDASGQNRRMLEIRNKSYESSLDNAAMVRVCDNNVWSNYRIFHAGMETAVPIPNGGTGATTAADARYNLLVNTSLLTTTTPTTAILKGIQVSELPAAANGTQDPQGGVLLTAAINNNRGIQIGNGYAVDSLKWRFIHSNQTSDAGTTGYSPWYTIYHSGNIDKLATALSNHLTNANGVSF